MNIQIDNLVKFIKDAISNARAKGVILGMSGGKDSFVAAKLACLAVGNENVFGLIMPNGIMSDLEDAKTECELLGIKYKIIDISKMVNDISIESKTSLNTDTLSSVSQINIAPRVRMNLLYTVGGTLGYLVANTSNLSERMVGYSTKWGDSAGDFSPLGMLTKTEVCELGIDLELPENLVYKTPADGLTGSSDENILGFSYSELDEFIRHGKQGENFEKISKLHTSTAHKREPILTYNPNYKNYFNN